MFERRSFSDEADTHLIRGPFLHVVFVSGPYRTREARLEAAEQPSSTSSASTTSSHVIGRSPGCSISLPTDHSVSPLHARLQFYENSWWLSDLGSDAGTFALIEDCGRRVALGDVFRIAHTELQVSAVPDEYACL